MKKHYLVSKLRRTFINEIVALQDNMQATNARDSIELFNLRENGLHRLFNILYAGYFNKLGISKSDENRDKFYKKIYSYIGKDYISISTKNIRKVLKVSWKWKKSNN